MPIINVRWSDNTKDLARNLKEGVNQIEATKSAVDRMVKALAGDNLVAAAHKWTAAIQEMGGIARISSADQVRAFGTITKAIEALERQSKPVPDALRAMATELKATIPQASALSTWMGSLGTQLLTTAGGFISAQAVIGGVSKAFGTMKTFVVDSVQAYAEAEAAQKKLTTAMQAQGTAIPKTIDQYNALASQFQRTTVFSDDLINNMQALLIQIGDVMPAQMEGALTAATNLASGLGIDLETATRLVAKAAAGHIESLGKYGITIDAAAFKTKGLTVVLDEIEKHFGGQAAAALDTYTGRFERLKNEWNNVQETAGRLIVTNPLVEAGLRLLGDTTHDLDTNTTGLNASLSELAKKGGLKGYGELIAFFEDWARSANETAAAMERLKKADVKPSAGHLQTFAPVASHDTAATDAAAKREAEIAAKIVELRTAAEVQLSALDKARIASLNKWGMGEQEIAKFLHLSDAAVHVYLASLKTLAAEQKKHADAVKEIAEAEGGFGEALMSVNVFTDEHVRRLLAMGKSHAVIAEALNLTETQVDAVAVSVKLVNDLTTLNTTVTVADAAAFGKLGGTIDNLAVPALQDLFDLRKKIHDIEQSGKVGTIDISGLKVDVETVGRLKAGFEAADQKSKALKQAVHDLAGAFGTLAQISGGAFGGAAQGIGQVIGAANVLQTAMGSLDDAIDAGTDTWANWASAGAAVFSVAMVGIGMVMAAVEKSIAKIRATQAELTSNVVSFQERLNALRLTITPEEVAALTDKLYVLFSTKPENIAEIHALTAEMDALLDHYEKIAGLASKYGMSASELKQAAQDAHEVYDLMVKAGDEFTQGQLDAAFLDFQKALAATGDAAAIMWLKLHGEDTGPGAAAGYKTIAQLQALADTARKTYEDMRDSGLYAAEDIADAFEKANKAQERALGKTSKALDDLTKKRDDLKASYANEAPEAEMGSTEKAARAQVADLNKQIEAGATAAGAVITKEVGKAGEATTQTLQDGIVDGLSGAGLAADGAKTTIANAFAGFKIAIPFSFYQEGPGPGPAPDPNRVIRTKDHPGGPIYFAGGGVAHSAGLEPFSIDSLAGPRGIDTIPAWLSEGETVRTVPQEAALRAGAPAPAADATPITVHVNTYLDGQLVAENTITQIGRGKRGLDDKMLRALGIE